MIPSLTFVPGVSFLQSVLRTHELADEVIHVVFEAYVSEQRFVESR